MCTGLKPPQRSLGRSPSRHCIWWINTKYGWWWQQLWRHWCRFMWKLWQHFVQRTWRIMGWPHTTPVCLEMPFCFQNFVYLLTCLFCIGLSGTGRRSARTHYSCSLGFALAACPTPCRVHTGDVHVQGAERLGTGVSVGRRRQVICCGRSTSLEVPACADSYRGQAFYLQETAKDTCV